MKTLNKIEEDYWEDRPYKDEADKRSQQFREICQVVNALVDEVEKLNDECMCLQYKLPHKRIVCGKPKNWNGTPTDYGSSTLEYLVRYYKGWDR